MNDAGAGGGRRGRGRAAVLAVAAALAAGLVPGLVPGLVLGLATPLGASPAAADPIDVAAVPIRDFEPGRRGVTRFGDLEFLGGLELSSSDRRFGGFSGILDRGGGRFLAVADYGLWFTGRIVDDAAGRPAAIAEAELVPLTAPDGGRFRTKISGDAEAVAIDRSRGAARVLVALESTAKILDYPDPPVGRRPRVLPPPPAFADAERNGRGEALAVVPGGAYAGAMLTFVEQSRDGGRIEGGIRIGGAWQPIAVAASGGYALTDAAFLPGGDLLLLERRYGLFLGVGMRIRRIPARSIAPGALLDGPVLMEADLSREIDNMEGLAVGRDGQGRTILTVISDDNRSMLQRTLLLRFALPGG